MSAPVSVPLSWVERTVGCLVGTAVGDSLLLPAEGLSRQRISRRYPGPLRQRLICGRGLLSDDSEHIFLTTQAMLASRGDPQRFALQLAQRLRWWLLALPGGCGKATALGLLRSWCGVPPSRSGVFSAGNGPAMRAAIIGLSCGNDRARLNAYVDASTRITHSDPRAACAARAVAIAAAAASQGQSELEILALLSSLEDPDWNSRASLLSAAYARSDPVDAMARDLGCPNYVSGYAYHSIPLALYAWLRHRWQPADCLGAVLRCGGDTDTAGAIAGALLGIDGGERAFPSAWVSRIADRPLSMDVLRQAGHALAQGDPGPIRWRWWLQPLRNLVFVLVVVMHVFYRLKP